MIAVSNAVPVELGTKSLERVSRLLRAADTSLTTYRNCPNYPELQSLKAASWSEYQACLAELMEALNA